MSISQREYLRRYAGIREIMRKDGLDSILVVGLSDDFNRGNIRYVTGSGRGGYCIIPPEGKPVFLTGINQSTSPKFPRITEALDLLEIKETDKIGETVVQELSKLDHGHKIGLIGMNCITVPVYLEIQEKFGSQIINTPELFKPLREIKSAEEIAMLRQAAAVADKVYLRLREIIRPGLDEFKIYGEVKKVIYENGCSYSFDLIDAAGSSMNMSFHPTEDKLEENGTLFMEISPSYDGYYAQLPVTLPVGRYLPHVREMVKAWNKSDKAVQKYLYPGTKISDIYQVLVNSIQDSGFMSPHRPGHSVGLDILDFWSITESNTATLQPGMVIAVHASCLVKLGGDGVGMGYTYVINEKGPERLSRIDLAKELIGE